jgi:ribosomal protein L33
MSHKHHSCFAWSCEDCDYECVGKTEKQIDLKERMHLKVCKKTGRTKPQISHTEVEQICYSGLAKRQNSLYHNFKHYGKTISKKKQPEHLEEAKFCEHILKQMITSLTPQFDASHLPLYGPSGSSSVRYGRKGDYYAKATKTKFTNP